MKKKEKKTALVLSGGGSRGAYQIGAWQALEELGWKFDMVVGVSVGSLNGAMVVQKERLLAENLWRELSTDNIFDVSAEAQASDFALEFIKQGGAGSKGLQNFVDKYLDDERMRESEIDYGLLTVEFPTLAPHYLWKDEIPKGEIGSFVMASSSAYPAIQFYEIDGKRYIDGGFENNMPIHMAVEHGATDIVAIYLNAVGKFDKEKELKSAEGCNLTLVETKWDLGNFLLFDKENTARIIRLGYMDTMKAFGVYDGNFFSFIKGDIEKRQLSGADAAAKVFDLDPVILYSKDLLLEKLGPAVKAAEAEFKDPVKTGRQLFKAGTTDLKKAADFFTALNKKVACLIIARDLEDKKENSIFISRPAIRVLGELIVAARFIQKNGLL